jgi:hypothetical protein
MKNLLLGKIEYKVEETPGGVWRRFVYPTGASYVEYRSNTLIFGLPMIHFTSGRCPETGKRKIARGFIALGRKAVGVIAIGQASAGIVALGQASLGLLLCLAQAGTGLIAIGQLALGAIFGAGQLASGATAIGQLAVGKYVLAQIGFGRYLWVPGYADPEAVKYFHETFPGIMAWLASHLPFLNM